MGRIGGGWPRAAIQASRSLLLAALLASLMLVQPAWALALPAGAAPPAPLLTAAAPALDAGPALDATTALDAAAVLTAAALPGGLGPALAAAEPARPEALP